VNTQKVQPRKFLAYFFIYAAAGLGSLVFAILLYEGVILTDGSEKARMAVTLGAIALGIYTLWTAWFVFLRGYLRLKKDGKNPS
jgi:hypothetical protein